MKPFRTFPATPQSFVINDEAIEVGFSQIANAPDAYLNQLVRVQGAYVPLTVVKCPNQKGPILHWAMVAEELQMNAYGFERIVPLVVEGQQLIVEGVWRRHAGPAGCGKEPPTELIYYLDIKQILQPNPILRAVPVSVADSAEINTTPPQLEQPTNEVEAPPPGGSSEVNAATPSGYPVPTLDNSAGVLIPSPTRDLSPPTPTPSITPTPRQATNGTQPTNTPQPTATAEPTDEPPTPAPTRTSPPTSVPRATVTPLPGETSVPATPTEEATTDGTATATATATSLPDGSATPTSDATVDPEATETLTPTPTPTGPTSTPDPEATETPTATPTPTSNPTLDAATMQPTTAATLSPIETPDSAYPAPEAPEPTVDPYP